MNNTNNLQNSNSQNKIEYPRIIFAFDRKDFTLEELLTVFSSDFSDLIYQHNVLPPESPIAAIRVTIPH